MVKRRKTRTYRSFLKKVELLESWVRSGGVPPGVFMPQGPVSLARWKDDELGLQSWGSPNIVAPNGPYPDLRERFDLAARALLGTKKSKADRTRKQQVSDLKKINQALVEQNVRLLEDNSGLRDELKRQSDLLRLSRSREQTALKKLSKLSSLTTLIQE